MMEKMKKQNKKKESIIIPKKAMFGIAPAIAIIAVLLFGIGIVIGILIARGYFEK